MPGEFSRIARFLSHFDVPPAPRGPGDDCAVLPAPRGQELCVTTDSVVEGVHFTREHFRPEDIGHKALAVNVSDLAAMGARPSWFVCALALPPDLTDRALAGLARGMAALAREVDIRLVGGNLTRARELSVTLTAAGHVPRGRALLRGGGRPGDLLYVSGTLGDAALGLSLLHERVPLPRGGEAAREARAAVERQRRPRPRVRLGLLARAYAHAALDLSDGLAQDLGHLCAASGVGARVQVEALPLSGALRALARRAGRQEQGRPRATRGAGHAGGGEEAGRGKDADLAPAARLALSGGEDYELLLAVPPSRVPAFERACQRAGERVTRVGELTRAPDIHLLGRDGRRLAVPSGYDHFRQRPI